MKFSTDPQNPADFRDILVIPEICVKPERTLKGYFNNYLAHRNGSPNKICRNPLISEPLLSSKHLDEILGTLHNALPDPSTQSHLSPEELDRCVGFVSDVAVLLYRDMKVQLICLSLRAIATNRKMSNTPHSQISL